MINLTKKLNTENYKAENLKLRKNVKSILPSFTLNLIKVCLNFLFTFKIQIFVYLCIQSSRG